MKLVLIVLLLLLSAVTLADTESPNVNVTAPATQATSASGIGTFCEDYLTVIANSKGKITEIKYKVLSEEDFRNQAQTVLADLQQKLAADSHSNRHWMQFEHFAELSTSAFDIIRQVAAKFAAAGGEKGLPTLEKANTLLYGVDSLNGKIQQLETLLGKNSFFTRKETREKQIKEIAANIKDCRAAIVTCKIALPTVLAELNSEAQVLSKARAVVNQEITLITHIKSMAASYLDPETAKLTENTLSKKMTDLQMGVLTLEALASETDKLIRAVVKVYGDADSVNEGALQRAVIRAGQESLDIREAIAPIKAPAYKNAAEDSKTAHFGPEYRVTIEKIRDTLKSEYLTTTRRLLRTWEMIESLDRITQTDFVEMMEVIMTYTEVARSDDLEVLQEFCLSVGVQYDASDFGRQGVGYRTLVFNSAIRKVVPDRNRTAADWHNWIRTVLKDIDAKDSSGLRGWLSDYIGIRFGKLADAVYDRKLLP